MSPLIALKFTRVSILPGTYCELGQSLRIASWPVAGSEPPSRVAPGSSPTAGNRCPPESRSQDSLGTGIVQSTPKAVEKLPRDGSGRDERYEEGIRAVGMFSFEIEFHASEYQPARITAQEHASVLVQIL
jgi:hypothetical protein